MDVEDIANEPDKTLDILKSVGKLHLDESTHRLTFVGEDIITVTNREFKKVLGLYKLYIQYLKEGGNFYGVVNRFDQFLVELKIKYFGRV